MATVITIRDGGKVWLDVGKSNANRQYRDALGNMGGVTVTTNADGWGDFPVSGGQCLRLEPGLGGCRANTCLHCGLNDADV